VENRGVRLVQEAVSEQNNHTPDKIDTITQNHSNPSTAVYHEPSRHASAARSLTGTDGTLSLVWSDSLHSTTILPNRYVARIQESREYSDIIREPCFSPCAQFVASPYHHGVRIFAIPSIEPVPSAGLSRKTGKVSVGISSNKQAASTDISSGKNTSTEGMSKGEHTSKSLQRAKQFEDVNTNQLVTRYANESSDDDDVDGKDSHGTDMTAKADPQAPQEKSANQENDVDDVEDDMKDNDEDNLIAQLLFAVGRGRGRGRGGGRGIDVRALFRHLERAAMNESLFMGRAAVEPIAETTAAIAPRGRPRTLQALPLRGPALVNTHPSRVVTARFHPFYPFFASGSLDGTVVLHEPEL